MTVESRNATGAALLSVLLSLSGCDNGRPHRGSSSDTDVGNTGSEANGSGTTADSATVDGSSTATAVDTNGTSMSSDSAEASSTTESGASTESTDAATATTSTGSAPSVEWVTTIPGPDTAVGLQFAGLDPDNDTNRLVVTLLDGDGAPLGEPLGVSLDRAYGRPNRYFSGFMGGYVEAENGTFSGFAGVEQLGLERHPLMVELVFFDRESNQSSPLVVPVNTNVPTVLELGDPCDLLRAANTCPRGSMCDRFDGDTGPFVCLQPHECPFSYPALTETIVDNSRDAMDFTVSSCTSSRGNVGGDTGATFVAPSTGTYRFSAQGRDYGAVNTLFVRRECDLPGSSSEIACAHAMEFEPQENYAELTLDLVEGQTIYVFVETTWAGGGAYQLSVEPL